MQEADKEGRLRPLDPDASLVKPSTTPQPSPRAVAWTISHATGQGPSPAAVYHLLEAVDGDPLNDVMDWLGKADLRDEDLDDPTTLQPRGLSGSSSTPILPQAPPLPLGGKNAWSSSSLAISRDGSPGGMPQFRGGASRATASAYCGLRDVEGRLQPPQVEPEDEEWDARQQQTGAAGRLVIYEAGERPREDILLRGGGSRRIMVASVTEGGKAAQAGVKAGDVLVSLDGTKEFKGQSADAVHAGLRAPVMLVFMGFVGKLHAEVRLNYKQKICGLSSQHQVIYGRPESPVQVVDEVVFQPSNATLFLATMPSSSASRTSPRTWSSLPAGCREAAVTPRSGFAGGDNGISCGEDEDEEDCIDIDKLTSAVAEAADCIDIDSLTSAVAEALREGHHALADALPPPLPQPQELAAVYELRGPEARKIVSRALSRTVASEAAIGGRAGMLVKPGGDSAQTPRAMGPLPPTFSSRFARDRMPLPKGLGVKLDSPSSGEGGGRICDAESWWT